MARIPDRLSDGRWPSSPFSVFGIFLLVLLLRQSAQMAAQARDIIGLTNYTNAIGPLTYLLVFDWALGCWSCLCQNRHAVKENKEGGLRSLVLNVPILLAGVALTFIRWTVLLLPNVLTLQTRSEAWKRHDLFMQLLQEAFTTETVLAARTTMFWFILPRFSHRGHAVLLAHAQNTPTGIRVRRQLVPDRGRGHSSRLCVRRDDDSLQHRRADRRRSRFRRN